jgi:hypothetical protein
MAESSPTKAFGLGHADILRESGEGPGSDLRAQLSLNIREAWDPSWVLGGPMFSLLGEGLRVIRPASGTIYAVLNVESGGWRVHAGDWQQRDVASVDVATNTLRVEAHGYAQVDGPTRLYSTAALPLGVEGLVWTRTIDADTVALYHHAGDAMQDAHRIHLQTEGRGALTLGFSLLTPPLFGDDTTIGGPTAAALPVGTYPLKVGGRGPSTCAQSLSLYAHEDGARLTYWFVG